MRLTTKSIVFASPLFTALFTLATFASFATFSTFAAPANQSAVPARVHPDQVRLQGLEVDSIKDVETLSDWRTLDTQHLTLRVNHGQQYLLTLRDHCHQLRGAQLVGISMTNQEIWADFDHVAADGYECRIDTITQLGRGRS